MRLSELPLLLIQCLNSRYASIQDFSVDFTCAVFTYISERLDQNIVHSLVQEAVQLHSCWAKGLLSNLPDRDVNVYASSAANKLLVKLGYSEVASFQTMHLHRESYKQKSKVKIKGGEAFQKLLEDLYNEDVSHLHKEKTEELARKHGNDYLSICLWFLQKEGDRI